MNQIDIFANGSQRLQMTNSIKSTSSRVWTTICHIGAAIPVSVSYSARSDSIAGPISLMPVLAKCKILCVACVAIPTPPPKYLMFCGVLRTARFSFSSSARNTAMVFLQEFLRMAICRASIDPIFHIGTLLASPRAVPSRSSEKVQRVHSIWPVPVLFLIAFNISLISWPNITAVRIKLARSTHPFAIAVFSCRRCCMFMIKTAATMAATEPMACAQPAASEEPIPFLLIAMIRPNKINPNTIQIAMACDHSRPCFFHILISQTKEKS